MPELSLQNYAEISRDVDRQEITYSHLAAELTDHICCDVEHEMGKGLEFHDAYAAVRKKMGVRRLKEIQEETLYAVDTKYRQMKNTMKISGVAGTVMLGFAALFKIMHWPWAGIILTLGALLLAFVFMPSALTVLWKETHNAKRLFLYISAFVTGVLFIAGIVYKVQHWPMAGLILALASMSGIFTFVPALLLSKLKDQENRSKKIVYILGSAGLICYILGILFKIQHWPMAAMLLSVGLALIFFVVFPWYTWISWKDDEHVSSKFIYMVIGALAIGVPSLLISLNVQRYYDEGFYPHQSEQKAMFNYLADKNQSFMNNCTDTNVLPVLNQIDTKTSELLQVINALEADMISEGEGQPAAPAVITNQIIQTEHGPEIQFGKLQSPFHTMPFSNFLEEGASSRSGLDNALKEYSGYLTGVIPAGETMQFEELLEPTVYLAATGTGSEMISLMSALHMLGLMKNGILTAESIALSAVSGN